MHKLIKASRRYAKSLLDLAIEQNKVAVIEKDMALIRKAYEDNKELLKFFQSPLIKSDKKEKIVNAIFKGKIDDMTLRFINILVSKHREAYIPGVARSFRQQLREHHGISLAEVTTAIPLDDAQRAKVKAMAEAVYKKVQLLEVVNPDVIAGFSIKVGDKMYDETIASRIKAMKRHYLNNPYVAKY